MSAMPEREVAEVGSLDFEQRFRPDPIENSGSSSTSASSSASFMPTTNTGTTPPEPGAEGQPGQGQGQGQDRRQRSPRELRPGETYTWTASWGKTYVFRVPPGRQVWDVLGPESHGNEVVVRMDQRMLDLIERNCTPRINFDELKYDEIAEVVAAFSELLFREGEVRR